MNDERQRTALFVAIIAIAGIAAYANSLHGAFQFDDVRTIRFNYTLRDLTDWKQILQFERYRPLLMATFALNFAISGHSTFSYHVTNLVIHVSVCILFFLFMRRLCADRRVSAMAAVLMATHPLNTESVSYISSRSTLLCTFFCLSSLLFFESHARRPRKWAVAGYVSCFFMAALTKEEAAVIPLAALLLQYLFHGRDSVKKHAGLHVGMLLLLFVAACFRLSTFFGHGQILPHPLYVWLPTEVPVWFRYLGLAVFPHGLTVDHDVEPLSFLSPRFWVAILALFLIGWFLWRFRRTRPFVTFWGTWFFLSLLPSSSLVPLNEFMSEHRAYLGMLGFSAMFSYFLITVCLPRAKPAWIFQVVILCLLGFYITATHYRNRVWADEFALWYDAVQKAPGSIKSRTNLGAAYTTREAYDLAIQEYLKVLEISPRSQHAFSGLGVCYLRKGEFDRAQKYFQNSLSIDPSLTDAQVGIAIVYYRQHRCSAAIPYFEAAYPERKESLQILSMMSECYMIVGRPGDAVKSVLRAIELGTQDPAWYSNLIRASFAAKRPGDAARYYDLYRSRLSQDPRTQYYVADVLLQIGRAEEGARILRRISADPQYGEEARKRLAELQ